MFRKIEDSFDKLLAYCTLEEFRGFDPYDGLNSRIFQSLPWIKKSRFARLAWIQGFKRSPINLRPLVGIKKDYNPKALGLFLSGYCALYRLDGRKEYLDKIKFFISKILELSSNGYNGLCWGYNFDWESKAFFQPKYTPTVVVSSFIANSLLDAYDLNSDKNLLIAARSTCDFILKDLNRTYSNNGNFAFSYSKLDNSVVYNASLLGSQLLARVYSLSGERMLVEEARKSVEFCCVAQQMDGSWVYGTQPFHHWVDNFHTGYNLVCISDYMKFSGDHSFETNLEKGFSYYIDTFFTDEGVSRYYNNSLYPIDIHAHAQFVITTTRLGKFHEKRELTEKILMWTIDNMQSPKGYFYYQINKFYKSRIPYMRWSQAWMFYAMSVYLLNARKCT
jgi:hypothetical protein